MNCHLSEYSEQLLYHLDPSSLQIVLLILPFLGFKEKTTPLPLSITEPILGGSPDMAMARDNSNYKEKL